MSFYNGFAYIYDELIDQDYTAWVDYIEEIFAKMGKKPGLVLDLACGTGNITTILARRGYDMIGVDISPDMLGVAMQKATDEKLDIRYLCQDMTEFELYGTVDAIICTLDAINYVTSVKKVQRLFSLVHNYLNPDGIFIFDISSEYKLAHVLGNNTFVTDEGNVFYVWENSYSEKRKLLNSYLTFFTRDGTGYSRIDEQHVMRAFGVDELKKMITTSGLEYLGCYHNFTLEKPKKNSERLFFVAKRIC